MKPLFYGHSASMGYLKMETLDWKLRVTGRKRRKIGKSELRKRLLRDLAKKREA